MEEIVDRPCRKCKGTGVDCETCNGCGIIKCSIPSEMKGWEPVVCNTGQVSWTPPKNQ